MNNIRLSICIATRNRANTIGQTLDSIIQQATDEVEIVIVDGASTDNTEQIVGTYKELFPRLRYFKQTNNGGFDRDICRAVELANGRYCWFMSDDDIFKEGAIPTVLGHVLSDFDLIVVNTESRNTDLSRVLLKQNMPMLSDRVYRHEAFRELFIDTVQHLSYVAAVVIKKALWTERVKGEYLGSWFVHVGVIFQKPFTGNTIVVKEPLIAVRRGNVSWSSRSFELWLFKWPQLIWSFSSLDDSAKESVTHREPWKSLLVLMRFRGSHCYSASEYSRWIKDSDCSSGFKSSAKVIALLPTSLLSPLLVFYLTVFKKESKASIYEIIRNPVLRRMLHVG